MSLFAELQRRNVIRMAGLYLVGAWLITQVAATVLPMFGAPDWVARSIVVVLALAFVPVLVFAWIYELTPEGLRRDAGAPAEGATVNTTARKMDRLFLVGALAVLALMIADRVWAPATTVAVPAAQSATAPSTTTEPVAAAPMPNAPTPTTDQASIAVLPFVNMSTDVENGFFADGISEEILNVLAGVDGLKVASRTSAFSFKGKDLPIPEIARQLGVQHVLEGSVRRQGQRVRITAQLIHAGSDGHLWSQTYDRDLTDIFQVQEEIARAITGELEGVLGTRNVEVQSSTDDMVAYELFLRARARFHQRTGFRQAIEELGQAVERDPDFAEAWIVLASTWIVAPGYTISGITMAEAGPEAIAAVERAHELAPEHPTVLGLQALLAENRSDLIASMALYRKAAERVQKDSTPLMWYGQALQRAGYIEQSVAELERALQMEPGLGINHGSLAISYLSDGQLEKAAAESRAAAALGWEAAEFLRAVDTAAGGRRELAADQYEAALIAPIPEDERFLAALRDPAKIAAWRTGISTVLPPEESVAFGEPELLLDVLLERARDGATARDLMFALRSFWLPHGKALREHPKAMLLAREIGLFAFWEKEGYPRGCRRVDGPAGEHLDCAGMHPQAAR